MRRTKAWWAQLTPEERKRLCMLEQPHWHDCYDGEPHPSKNEPIPCKLCKAEREELIEKANKTKEKSNENNI